jgi:UDPglucose 6-dehydrogenase
MSRVAVIGTGYVGLTSGAFLAHLGHDVCCADIVPEKVEALSRGEIPIIEDGLEQLVREGLACGRLTFVVGAAYAVAGRDFVFLCLPTPEQADGSADVSYIMDVAREIGPLLSPGSIVINKSTVPVGTTRAIEQALRRSDVAAVSNPEFLREGTAVADFHDPHRIVIGCDDEATGKRVARLFDNISAPVVFTSPASAELIKYASNAFLATRLSFINAVANLCEAVGADIRDVALGMGYDRRIGFDVLQPGPGWGGSCLPKDTKALVRIGENAGYDFSLLRGVIAANDEQHNMVIRKIQAMAGGSIADVTVAIWGLTFKAGTDDCRHSPAVTIANRLVRAGAKVRAYDPCVRRDLPGLEVCLEPYAACQDASMLVVLTEWEEFRTMDFDKVAALMTSRCIVDARNLLDPAAMRRDGFQYTGIGRP